MRRPPRARGPVTAEPDEVAWTVTVTEPLPHCPNVRAGWERIATQSAWDEWRSPSQMRGESVDVKVVPPAVEPLSDGDEYVVKVGRFMTIRCRVLESTGPGASSDDDRADLVFDALGIALGGLVKARFRFTIFVGPDGVVMARAQERIMSLPVLVPSAQTLASEHRHTLRDLDRSFRDAVDGATAR